MLGSLTCFCNPECDPPMLKSVEPWGWAPTINHQNSHPPSQERSSTNPRMVNHLPLDAHPLSRVSRGQSPTFSNYDGQSPSSGRLPNILKIVTRHLQDGWSPTIPTMLTSYSNGGHLPSLGQSSTILRMVTNNPLSSSIPKMVTRHPLDDHHCPMDSQPPYPGWSSRHGVWLYGPQFVWFASMVVSLFIVHGREKII